MSAAREYRLVARLADTDYGESWRGVASGPAGPVPAFVALLAPHAAEAQVVGALGQRVQALSRLAHPGLALPWEVGRAGDRVVLTAPYVDGHDLGTLFSRLRAREIAVSLGRAVAVLAEAADAVAALHAAGIPHASLAPTNVFVCFDGVVRVTCANLHPALEVSKASRHLALRGRKAYRAPELARSGASDVLTDVYALGALLYELATGKSLEGAGSRGTSTRADALLVPSRVDRRIPMKFDPVVGKALETARTRRYKDAAATRDGLRAWLETMGHPVSRDDLAELAATVMPNEVVRFAFDPGEASDPMAPLPAGFTVTPLPSAGAAGPRRYALAAEAPASPSSPGAAGSPSVFDAPPASLAGAPPGEATVKAEALTVADADALRRSRMASAPVSDATVKTDALAYPAEPATEYVPRPAFASAALYDPGTDSGSSTQPGRGPDLGFPEAAPPAAPGLAGGPLPPAAGAGDTLVTRPHPRLGDPAADGWFRDTREVAVLPPTGDLGAPIPGAETDELGDPLGPGGHTLGNTAYRLSAVPRRPRRGLYLGGAAAGLMVLAGAAYALGHHRRPPPPSPSPTAALAGDPAAGRRAPIDRPAAGAPSHPRPARSPETPQARPSAPARHRAERPDPFRHGLLTVYASRRARVYLDGHYLGHHTPLKGYRIPVGHHDLLLVAPGGRRRHVRVHVRPGRLTRVRLRL